jgi:hypothetical protein
VKHRFFLAMVMLRKFLLLVSLISVVSLIASAQELTAREYAKAHGIPNRQSAITLSPPHACTISKQHPCVYYGGDIDPNDPEENGLSNENTLFIECSWTYTEVNLPAPLKISAAFTNNLQTFGIVDPQTGNWDFRIGVSEGNGGTDIGYGTGPAQLTATGRSAFGYEEYELLTRIPLSLPTGNVWFDVQPNCMDPNDFRCSELPRTYANTRFCCGVQPRYFESDSDGLNGINSKFTVTSNTGMGPTFADPLYGFYSWASWCHDEGEACGDGMSAGLIK